MVSIIRIRIHHFPSKLPKGNTKLKTGTRQMTLAKFPLAGNIEMEGTKTYRKMKDDETDNELKQRHSEHVIWCILQYVKKSRTYPETVCKIMKLPQNINISSLSYGLHKFSQ